MPENGYYNDPDPEQYEISGQDQYGLNGDLENYFENGEQKYIGGYMEYPNDTNNAQQVSVEHSYGVNQGKNVPIYSQVPFQPEQSRIEDMFQQLLMQMHGVNQRVAQIEQKQSQNSGPGFRLSYAEGNTPMKEGTRPNSTPNHPQTAMGVQNVHSAVSNLVENQQPNPHQSRKMRQDFCEHASHCNRPHENSPASQNLAPLLLNLCHSLIHSDEFLIHVDSMRGQFPKYVLKP